MTAAARVDLGWAVMDRANPGWWREDAENAIDLGTLDLAMGDKCILGQSCPLEVLEAGRPLDTGYSAFARHLSGQKWAFDVDMWAVEHGFQAGASDDVEGEYEELAAEWARRIRARRDAA